MYNMMTEPKLSGECFMMASDQFLFVQISQDLYIIWSLVYLHGELHILVDIFHLDFLRAEENSRYSGHRIL